MNFSYVDMNLSSEKCPLRVKFGIEKFEKKNPKNYCKKKIRIKGLQSDDLWFINVFCLNFRALKNAQAKLKAQQQQQQQQQEVSFKFQLNLLSNAAYADKFECFLFLLLYHQAGPAGFLKSFF